MRQTENIDRFCFALVVSKIHLNTLNETLQMYILWVPFFNFGGI